MINLGCTGRLEPGVKIDFVSPEAGFWDAAAYNKSLIRHALKSGYDWNVADIRALSASQLDQVVWPSGSFSRIGEPGFVWFEPYGAK